MGAVDLGAYDNRITKQCSTDVNHEFHFWSASERSERNWIISYPAFWLNMISFLENLFGSFVCTFDKNKCQTPGIQSI